MFIYNTPGFERSEWRRREEEGDVKSGFLILDFPTRGYKTWYNKPGILTTKINLNFKSLIYKGLLLNTEHDTNQPMDQ